MRVGTVSIGTKSIKPSKRLAAMAAGRAARQNRDAAGARFPAGWNVRRNGDGSIGIFAPVPRDGESPRTSDVVYSSQNRDLHELLGKLADHFAEQRRFGCPV